MDHNMERANWNALEESYDQLLYLLSSRLKTTDML